MKLEQCPQCGHHFKARAHRYSFGVLEALTPRMPSTRMAQEFAVRCPECGVAFVSNTLRWLGIVRYAQAPWFAGGVVLLVVLIAWLQ